jgi:hypothetical protein
MGYFASPGEAYRPSGGPMDIPMTGGVGGEGGSFFGGSLNVAGAPGVWAPGANIGLNTYGGGSVGDIFAPQALAQLRAGKVPIIGMPNPEEAASMMKGFQNYRPYAWEAPPTMVGPANVAAAQPFLSGFNLSGVGQGGFTGGKPMKAPV